MLVKSKIEKEKVYPRWFHLRRLYSVENEVLDKRQQRFTNILQRGRMCDKEKEFVLSIVADKCGEGYAQDFLAHCHCQGGSESELIKTEIEAHEL